MSSENLTKKTWIRFVSSRELGDFLEKAGLVYVSAIQEENVTRTYDVRAVEQLL